MNARGPRLLAAPPKKAGVAAVCARNWGSPWRAPKAVDEGRTGRCGEDLLCGLQKDRVSSSRKGKLGRWRDRDVEKGKGGREG